MKTFRVMRPCNVNLHQELVDAGVPVITVRGSNVDRNHPDLYQFAVVVTEDNVPANIESLINAHVENRTPGPWAPSHGKTREDTIRQYEEM